MIRNLWSWLRGHSVRDVPETLAVCEFECRATACRRAEWECCPYRLRDQADGLGHRVPWPPRLGRGPGGRGDRGRA